MKSIQEILTHCLGENPRQQYTIAANYLQGQIKHVPEDEQLAWAKERRDRDVLANKYGLELTRYYDRNDLEDLFEYGEFIRAVSLLCIEFYDLNGGEMSEQTRRALENNSFGFGYGDESTLTVISKGEDGKDKFIVSSIL